MKLTVALLVLQGTLGFQPSGIGNRKNGGPSSRRNSSTSISTTGRSTSLSLAPPNGNNNPNEDRRLKARMHYEKINYNNAAPKLLAAPASAQSKIPPPATALLVRVTPAKAKPSTTALGAVPFDIDPEINNIIGTSLIIGGAAILLGIGKGLDESQKQAREREEYAKFLEKSKPKPAKVYPKGPKQLEAEVKLKKAKIAEEAKAKAEAEAEAAARAEAMAVAGPPAVAASVAETASPPPPPPPPQPEPVVAAAPVATSSPPVPSTGSTSSGGPASYLDAITEVCEPPTSTSGSTTTSSGPTEECAGAITSYLDALSAGAAQPAEAGAGIASYLDTIASAAAASSGDNDDSPSEDSASSGEDTTPSFGEAVSDYLENVSSGTVSPPSVPAVKTFLDVVASGNVPPSGKAIAGYLDSLDAAAGGASRATGSGVPTYLDSVAASGGPSVSTGGSGSGGPTSYLDNIGTAAAAAADTEESAPSPVAAAPAAPVVEAVDDVPAAAAATPVEEAPVAEAPVVEEAPSLAPKSTGSYLDYVAEACDGNSPPEICAPAISNYLDALSTGAAQSSKLASAGISSYLDTVSGGVGVSGGGPGMASYLDAVGGGGGGSSGDRVAFAAPSAKEDAPAPPSTSTTEAAVSSYLEDVSSGDAGAPSAPEVKSYLDDLIAGSDGRVKPLDSVESSSGPPASTSGSQSLTDYLDAIAEAPASVEATVVEEGPESAPNTTGYLDNVAEACDGDALPSEDCKTAMTSYLDALSTGEVRPTPMGAAGITSYLDSLGGNPPGSLSKDNVARGYLDSSSSHNETATFAPVSCAAQPGTADAEGIAADNARLLSQLRELQVQKGGLEAKTLELQSNLESALTDKNNAEACNRDLEGLALEKELLDVRLQEAIQQNDAVVARVESLAIDNGRLVEEVAELQGQKQIIELKISELQSSLEHIIQEKDQVVKELEATKAAQQTVEDRERKLSLSLAQMESDLERALALSEESEYNVFVLKEEVASANAKLEAALEDKERSEAQIRDLTAAITELTVLVSQKFAELSDRLHFLSTLKGQLDDTTTQVKVSSSSEELKDKVDGLQSQILWVGDALSAQIEEAQAQIVASVAKSRNAADEVIDEAPTSISPDSTPGNEAAVSSYLSDVASGEVAAPSTTEIKDYLDGLTSGTVASPAEIIPPAAAASGSYLDELASSFAPRAAGSRVPSYLDSVQATGGANIATEGTGIVSYLDAINEFCETSEKDECSEECAGAITSYLDALSTGSAQPSTFAGAGISNYLETISGRDGVSTVGPGIKTYTDDVSSKEPFTVPTIAVPPPASPTPTSTSNTQTAVTDYLKVLSSGAVSAPAVSTVQSYLIAVASGKVAPDALHSYFDAASSTSTKTGTAVNNGSIFN